MKLHDYFPVPHTHVSRPQPRVHLMFPLTVRNPFHVVCLILIVGGSIYSLAMLLRHPQTPTPSRLLGQNQTLEN